MWHNLICGISLLEIYRYFAHADKVDSSYHAVKYNTERDT